MKHWNIEHVSLIKNQFVVLIKRRSSSICMIFRSGRRSCITQVTHNISQTLDCGKEIMIYLDFSKTRLTPFLIYILNKLILNEAAAMRNYATAVKLVY